jgi:hypothetical protein
MYSIAFQISIFRKLLLPDIPAVSSIKKKRVSIPSRILILVDFDIENDLNPKRALIFEVVDDFIAFVGYQICRMVLVGCILSTVGMKLRRLQKTGDHCDSDIGKLQAGIMRLEDG